MPDIDIDFADRDFALSKFKHIRASMKDDSGLKKHNTGVYFHSVPVDARYNVCSIPYIEAEKTGFFKVDFLNVSIYKGIQNEEHLVNLMNTEPLWDLLEQKDFVDLLFHVNGHSDILKMCKPKNVEQLAAVLAMIRPAKRYLIGQEWSTILKEVWHKPENGEYYFKKSHATAYAMAIIVQMNLICEGISYGYH